MTIITAVQRPLASGRVNSSPNGTLQPSNERFGRLNESSFFELGLHVCECDVLTYLPIFENVGCSDYWIITINRCIWAFLNA